MKEVRTRFAPSPTGYMHVGNLRTALYAYLIAKSGGGRFLLRIEDTDQQRLVEGAVDVIYATLRDAGLHWDEGPDIGGPVGPYVQSERMGMYKDYAEQLIESGHAYRCFCDKERLEELRVLQKASNQAPMYDAKCANLNADEIRGKLSAGESYVIRQKMPREGTTSFADEVYGMITVENATLDDQVLIKADGMPTYNFANVVDDHTMGISHVVRGSEYLSSAPKYNLLYEAFGWEIPVYVHCPPVMKTSTEKLSKRNGDAYCRDFTDKGYPIGALLNYIALLGWSPGGETEIFTLEELTGAFDIAGISKSPAIFDTQKLDHISGEWIRRMPPEEFLAAAMPWIRRAVSREDVDFAFLAGLLQPRCHALGGIPEQLDFIDALPKYEAELFVNKKMKTTAQTAIEALNAAKPALEAVTDWTAQTIHTALFDLIARLEVKNGWLLWPVRIAVTGKQFTPGGGVEAAYLLGKAETLRRIDAATDKLGRESC
ncbi:MAG: glutamate--tRNA ligase [Oscillospiraceae bacterium]|nr:glutamate--tRNA ligase [Oscillospiraceae bacterium]